MKLYYRGLSYELHASQIANRKTEKPFQSVQTTGSAYKLMYRGVVYHVNPNVEQDEITPQSTTIKLSYRGVDYIVNRTGKSHATIASQPVSARKKEI